MNASPGIHFKEVACCATLGFPTPTHGLQENFKHFIDDKSSKKSFKRMQMFDANLFKCGLILEKFRSHSHSHLFTSLPCQACLGS